MRGGSHTSTCVAPVVPMKSTTWAGVCIGRDSRRFGLVPGEMWLHNVSEHRHRVAITKRENPSKEKRTLLKLY